MNKLGLSAGRPSENKKTAALKAVADNKEPMMRVNFELNEAEHLKLKIFAARNHSSITAILRDFIAKNIPKQD